jgi:hypothetical protein
MSQGSPTQHISTWVVTLTSKMSENPSHTAASPLHPQRATVRCALSSAGIFRREFIDDTTTSALYLRLPSDEYGPFLMGYGIPINTALFQKDGARPHTSNAVFRFLHDVFEETIRPTGTLR